MARMNRIVEIDAGENGEYVRLQDGHQKFKSHERHRHSERKDRAEQADDTQSAQHGDEGAKHIKRDMASQDVGEQANAVRKRAGQERKYLNECDQRENVNWNPAWHEEPEEA